MGWDLPGVRETIGWWPQGPCEGVTKRPIRKVHLAHVQTSARLSQLVSRDATGFLA